MTNKNDQLVMAYFADVDVAEGAANSLKHWDKANDAVKLGAVAILTWDSDFKKAVAREVGQRDAKKGALWGAAIGAAAGILTAGVALIPGLLIGAAAGGGAGALNHKSLGMSDADRAQLEANLRNGGAALAVMVDDFEVADTQAELTRLGGSASSYSLSEETVEAMIATSEAQGEVEDFMGERSLEIKEEAVAVLVAAPALTAASAAALHDADMSDVTAVQAKAATAAGRAELGAATGLDRAAIDSIAYDLDLSRVKGLGRKSAALLKAAGVESVGDLAEYEADELAGLMLTANDESRIVENMPSETTIGSWIAQARELPDYLIAIKVKKDMLDIDKYEWSASKGDNPHKTKSDAIMFNRKQGYEVILMIQKICETFGFETLEDVKNVEYVIANDLPGSVRSQKNVYSWLVAYYEAL